MEFVLISTFLGKKYIVKSYPCNVCDKLHVCVSHVTCHMYNVSCVRRSTSTSDIFTKLKLSGVTQVAHLKPVALYCLTVGQPFQTISSNFQPFSDISSHCKDIFRYLQVFTAISSHSQGNQYKFKM